MVRLTGAMSVTHIQEAWAGPLTRLSCEIEGHPLGGGVLKLEPGEATRIILHGGSVSSPSESRLIEDAIETMKRWRHYA
jgi:hypothetical protein